MLQKITVRGNLRQGVTMVKMYQFWYCSTRGSVFCRESQLWHSDSYIQEQQANKRQGYAFSMCGFSVPDHRQM